MRYMLLIYSPEDAWTTEEWEACVATSTGLCKELSEKGQFLDASPLHPVNTATSIRVREGKRLISDGPFAETREQLGGYFLIDMPNLDEAMAFAARLPGAAKGTVEIRPMVNVPDLEKI